MRMIVFNFKKYFWLNQTGCKNDKKADGRINCLGPDRYSPPKLVKQ